MSLGGTNQSKCDPKKSLSKSGKVVRKADSVPGSQPHTWEVCVCLGGGAVEKARYNLAYGTGEGNSRIKST